jgi:hypothetical protein
VLAVADFLTPVLECFFTLAMGAAALSFAGALVEAAGACAANEAPATARVIARPQAAEVSFFMMFFRFLF